MLTAQQLTIRRYRTGEELRIGEIFRDAVHAIAIEHYTQEQCDAWAPAIVDVGRWTERCGTKEPFVAIVAGEIAGFLELDLEEDGAHIDCAYVNPAFARQGVMAKLIRHALGICEKQALTSIRVEASHCARPLFEKAGFSVIEEQQVQVRGISLTNYRMNLLLAQTS